MQKHYPYADKHQKLDVHVSELGQFASKLLCPGLDHIDDEVTGKTNSTDEGVHLCSCIVYCPLDVAFDLRSHVSKVRDYSAC